MLEFSSVVLPSLYLYLDINMQLLFDRILHSVPEMQLVWETSTLPEIKVPSVIEAKDISFSDSEQ